MRCLYIFDIGHFFVISFANIFSHSVDRLLDFFFFCCANAFSLIRFNLFTFAFISFALGDVSKNIAAIYIKDVLHIVSPRNLMISGLSIGL